MKKPKQKEIEDTPQFNFSDSRNSLILQNISTGLMIEMHSGTDNLEKLINYAYHIKKHFFKNGKKFKSHSIG